MPDSTSEPEKTKSYTETPTLDANVKSFDNTPKTIQELRGLVDRAKFSKEELEADPELLDYLLRDSSWRKEGFLFYEGVKVYGAGMKEEAKRKEGLSSNDIMHGAK